eukprot:IDg19870t1
MTTKERAQWKETVLAGDNAEKSEYETEIDDQSSVGNGDVEMTANFHSRSAAGIHLTPRQRPVRRVCAGELAVRPIHDAALSHSRLRHRLLDPGGANRGHAGAENGHRTPPTAPLTAVSDRVGEQRLLAAPAPAVSSWFTSTLASTAPPAQPAAAAGAGCTCWRRPRPRAALSPYSPLPSIPPRAKAAGARDATTREQRHLETHQNR